MRIPRIAVVIIISFALSACVTSLLVGDAQSKLMWALLKPLVGFDPNEVNLFEQPMIKNRMIKLLGSRYDGTMRLLKTANEIRQEGALFYVVSRYTPLPGVAQKTAEKAGFVWNADTNQMAIMLVTGGAPTVLAEQIDKAKTAITPSWPTELQQIIDNAEQTKQALQDTAVKKTNEMIGETLGLEGNQPLLDQIVEDALNGKSVNGLVKEKANARIKAADDIAREQIKTSSENVIEDSGVPLQQLKEFKDVEKDPEEIMDEEMKAILKQTEDVINAENKKKETP